MSWQIVATISCSDDTGPPYSLSFDRQPLSIGASMQNDIVLEGRHVSGIHAQLTLSRGTLTLDNKSRNGTFVGQERVERRALKSGEVVRIPPYEILFSVVAVPDEKRETEVAPLPDAPAAPSPRARPTGAAPVFRLEVLTGPPAMKGKQFRFPPAGMRIGRSQEADLTIEIGTLSRFHLEIRPRPNGEWHLKDLGSANGSFVNGVRVQDKTISPGDEIQLANEVVLRVLHDESTDSTQMDIALPRHQSPLMTRPFPAVKAEKAASAADVITGEDTTHRSSTSGISTRLLTIRSHRAEWNSKVLLLELEGRVDSYNYTDLSGAFDRLVDERERGVIVDTSKLTYIDHTGMGVLMKTITALERNGGRMVLIGANQRLMDSFSLSNVDGFLKGKVFSDERAARKELERHRI